MTKLIRKTKNLVISSLNQYKEGEEETSKKKIKTKHKSIKNRDAKVV